VLLRIGEFAQLASVSVRALRHYEDLGLLRPAQVDPVTGYRAYAVEQLSEVNRIVALKELGLSLSQVAELLGGVTVDQLRGMLALRRAQIETELDAQRAQLARVEARLRYLEREGTMTIDDIVQKQIPATQVVAIGGPVTEIVNRELARVLNAAEEQFDDLGMRDRMKCREPFLAYYEKDDTGRPYAFLTLPAPEVPSDLPAPVVVKVLPAVDVASAVRKGRMDHVFPQVLVDIHGWADAHGFECFGLHRVVALRPATSIEEADEQVFECQRPIRALG
jgi:DNA-binding transcriptional MerR regulator